MDDDYTYIIRPADEFAELPLIGADLEKFGYDLQTVWPQVTENLHLVSEEIPLRIRPIAVLGEISGWILQDGYMQSINDAIRLDSAAETIRLGTGSSILIDGPNESIRVGSTSGNYLTIDGANHRIRSSNYVSGPAGSGFTLEPTLLEVGNISARGLIRTAVFQKDVITANAGSICVLPNADTLASDMTSLNSSTLTTKGTATFAVGDILRIKDGLDDEWLEVTSIASAPTYSVTRDKGGDYNDDNNPAWTAGATVSNYGQSGDGLLLLTASETNAPYLAVATHAGSPWSSLSTRARVGNLNGFLSYVSDLYGFGAGDATQYFTYDPTNGVRIAGAINVLGDSYFSGNIIMSGGGTLRTSSSYPQVEISESGIRLKDSDAGGTYGTAVYSTDKYGFGATVMVMDSHYRIPWYEPKEPKDGSGNDMPSFRLFNRGADPSGGTYETGDLAVVNGVLKIYTGGAWTVVGTQT